MSENFDNKAIDALLSKGIGGKLAVRILGVRFRISMKIRPLYLGSILLIQKEQSKAKKVDSTSEPIWEMFERAENLKVFARIAAIAVLNRPLKIRLFGWILSKLILDNATIDDIQNTMVIVASQMNSKGFFFTTALIKGFEVLKRNQQAEDISPKTQSGEQSEK